MIREAEHKGKSYDKLHICNKKASTFAVCKRYNVCLLELFSAITLEGENILVKLLVEWRSWEDNPPVCSNESTAWCEQGYHLPVPRPWTSCRSECLSVVSTPCPSREGAPISNSQDIGIIPWTCSGRLSASLVTSTVPQAMSIPYWLIIIMAWHG